MTEKFNWDKDQAARNKKLVDDPDKAQEYANMVKAKGNFSPDRGGIVRDSYEEPQYGWNGPIESRTIHFHREATQEDYDKAIQAVDDLIALAEKEPTADKVYFAIARAGEMVRDVIFSRDRDIMKGRTAGPWPEPEKHLAAMERFTDARAKLIDLKERAKTFEAPLNKDSRTKQADRLSKEIKDKM